MATSVRPPCQARSHRTLTRILEATEALLTEKRFEQITIQEIVRQAGASVGAFYARFPNKQALLPALYERYDATIPRTIDQPPAHDLRERVGQVVERLLHELLSRRGILRAMSIHARTQPESIPAATRACRRQLHAAINDSLFEFAAEIDHPDPRLAIDIGVFMVTATFRDKLLFGEAPHASSFAEVAPERLRDEMARALYGYLRGAGPLPPTS